MVFENNIEDINSQSYDHSNDEVLFRVWTNLEDIGYLIEKSKKHGKKMKVPGLFGLNGKVGKSFDADGFNKIKSTVLEVEAGRGIADLQFLKDLFQTYMMHNVDFLVIAITNIILRKGIFLLLWLFLIRYMPQIDYTCH